MAPIRHAKYSYSEKMLSKTSKCQICGKLFKPQGIKSHATHCAARQTREIQRIDATKEYERDKEQAEELRVALVTSAYSTVRTHITQAGPSQVTCTLNEDNDGLPTPNISHSGHMDFVDQDMWEPHGDPAAQSDQSNVSMPPADFKTEFHPCSNTPSLFQSQEEFGQRAAATMAPDPHPWCPFIEEGDYLFAEIALQVGLNASQINGLLSLISRIVQGKANVTLWNDGGHAGDTVFQHNGHEYERFYSEPWTGDGGTFNSLWKSAHEHQKWRMLWWRMCRQLVTIVPESTKEEGKTGYTNYKHVIWHEAFLCIIDRLAELSKLGYKYECYDKITRWLFPLILILSADYEEQCMMSLIRGMKSKCPCPVWVPLEELSHLAKSFPTCTIRQAKEALTIYQEKKSAGEPILKALRLRPVANVFWKVENSELEEAVSFDRLHALHDGLFGHHSLEELKILLSKLPCKYAAQLEEQLAAFPSWVPAPTDAPQLLGIGHLIGWTCTLTGPLN
ncbi:hypothetical protein BKA82DRAFT_4020305 [Pisolithus tinctorius]|nr:hypothetical protein BKA82DRAFT_4020942 [Pisolithus tinctorius]KAI6139244.1 hypothetical protein BKA82DRAFT_4020305 [Pisolithus tinctorius]